MSKFWIVRVCVLSIFAFVLSPCWSEVGLSIGVIAPGTAVGNDSVVYVDTGSNPAFLIPSSVALIGATDYMLPLWNDFDIGMGISFHSIGVFEFPQKANYPFIPIYLSSVYKIFGNDGGVVTKVGASINFESYLGIGFRYKMFEFGMDFGLLDREIQGLKVDSSTHWRIPHSVPYGDYYLLFRLPLFSSENPIIQESDGIASGLTWTCITTGGLFYFVGAMLLNIL